MSDQRRPVPPQRQQPQRFTPKPKVARPPIPAAVFIAPTFAGNDESSRTSGQNAPDRKQKAEVAVRMTKSATEAAKRLGLDSAAVKEIMESATQVGPDRDHPDRIRFTRGNHVVLAAKDGVVLGVYRR